MAGQPTKYNKDMQALADDYVANYADAGDVIPSVEGLADYLDLARQTLYNWSEKHTEFLDTLDRIEQKQKKVTLNNGLTGDFNATIAKLVLANHGMHDKQDNQLTGKDGGKIEISQESVIQPVLSLKEIEQGTNTDS